jgi:amino acid adenylation domain-containing protein
MLGELVTRAAVRTPNALAVRAPDGDLTYAELDARANRIARVLAAAGVTVGDRVAIWLPKSVGAVAAMQAVLRLGAAYVPIDILSPPARALAVALDCNVRALVVTPGGAVLARDFGLTGAAIVDAAGLEDGALASISPDDLPLPARDPADLAYILYTSGSTGQPKGVCITHTNALAFVDWVVTALHVTESDRLSNHAPFHFDLSVLDLYAAFAAGAAVCLVPEGAAYAPKELVRFMREEQITVWYSVPSALVLMMDHGDLLAESPASLRLLLFAGETFPVTQLRRLRDAWPALALWNLYGPTETNVCTAYSVGPIAPEQTSIPIGSAVCGDRVWARKDDGEPALPGEEGELMVEGPTVFPGYWGKPRRGSLPYATGDLVRVADDGEFRFVGRLDTMVKVRGHRIELGEIEATLLRHAAVRGAAATVLGEGLSARVVAFLAVGASKGPSLLEVKRLCAEALPRYMIPDDAISMEELPRTINGKVDRQALAAMAARLGADARERRENVRREHDL